MNFKQELSSADCMRRTERSALTPPPELTGFLPTNEPPLQRVTEHPLVLLSYTRAGQPWQPGRLTAICFHKERLGPTLVSVLSPCWALPNLGRMPAPGAPHHSSGSWILPCARIWVGWVERIWKESSAESYGKRVGTQT